MPGRWLSLHWYSCWESDFHLHLGVLVVSGEPLKVSGSKSGFESGPDRRVCFYYRGIGSLAQGAGPVCSPDYRCGIRYHLPLPTPYFIRLANPFSEWLYKVLSPRTREFLDRYASGKKTVIMIVTGSGY